MKTGKMKRILGALFFTTALMGAGAVDAAPLYFPHVDTTSGWQTEIAIINSSPHQSVAGTLRALSNTGRLVDSKPVILPGQGRRQINVADEFLNHSDIGYIVYDGTSDTVHGYTKYYMAGQYRVAIPAVKEVNTGTIYVTHIDSSDSWWTGLSLVNMNASARTITITFRNDQQQQVGQPQVFTLAANEHWARSIAQLFNGQPRPDITSAEISNANGVIGLEIFTSNLASGPQMEGILLTDKTATTLYYPHVERNGMWTGIVAYNPSELESTLTITCYDSQGNPLSTSYDRIPGKGKYVGSAAGLNLPEQTAWFRIDSTQSISGFEIIGSNDRQQLAAYAGNGGGGMKQGAFAKLETDGWTTITLVNTENSSATVTLAAYADDGTPVAARALTIGSHAKLVKKPEELFPQGISRATYIAYSSDRNMVGLQLNGSTDGTMLDGLPGLSAGGNGGGEAVVNTCADGSYCVSPLTCSPLNECICPAGWQLCGHSCIPAGTSCCPNGSYCEYPAICASDNSCTSDGGAAYGVTRHMFANVCAEGMIYGYTGPNYTVCNMYLNAASEWCSKVINSCHGE